MLLKTTKKRRMAALLALSACALILVRRPVPTTSAAPALPLPAATTTGAPETLKQALAAAKREGFALNAQDLQAPLPPPQQNAAPLYTELARQPRQSEPDWSISETPQEGMPSEAQIAALRKSLALNADYMERIHQAAARPQCVFLRDWARPDAVTYPEYASMKYAARCLTMESLLLLHDGKPLEAVRAQALGFVIARHAAQDPTCIAYYIACAIQYTTLRGMQNILFVAGANAAVTRLVRDTVEQNRARFSLIHGLHGHMAEVVMMMEGMRTEYPKEIEHWRHSPGAPRSSDGTVPVALNAQKLAKRIDRGELLAVQQMRGLAAAIERPYREAQEAMSKLDFQADTGPPDSAVAFPAFTPRPFLQGPQMAAQMRAMEESVRAAAALLDYKAAHSAFPDVLKAALDLVPADPFASGAFGYRKDGAGFVLYSVGTTGEYNARYEPNSSFGETCLRYPPREKP